MTQITSKKVTLLGQIKYKTLLKVITSYALFSVLVQRVWLVRNPVFTMPG